MSTLVLVIGGALTALLVLNAVGSAAQGRRRELTWFRAEVAGFALMGTAVVYQLARSLGL
jgi:hypothetical protein